MTMQDRPDSSEWVRLRLRDTRTRARAAYVNTIQCHGEKWKYEPTFFLAKNKNEDYLGWTADLKINLDKL